MLYRITYLSAERSFRYLDKGVFFEYFDFFPISIIYYGSVLTVHSTTSDTFCNLSNVLTYLLTHMLHGAEKLTGLSQSRNSPQFMKPEGTLTHSETHRFSPCPHITIHEDPS